MTKYQDLKHVVKRSWKLKNAKAVPMMMKNLMGMTTKNLTKIFKKPSLGIALQTNYSWKPSWAQ